MQGTNGETNFPTIKLAWNAEAQVVGVQFNPKEFVSWEFVLMVLEGAKQQVQNMKVQSQMAAMAQAEAEAQAVKQVRGRLQL